MSPLSVAASRYFFLRELIYRDASTFVPTENYSSFFVKILPRSTDLYDHIFGVFGFLYIFLVGPCLGGPLRVFSLNDKIMLLLGIP